MSRLKPDDVEALGLKAAGLAQDAKVYVGTSSWKYPGWVGSLYHSERYETKGVFSEAKFERECLREYAEVFSTVCVDATYYQFPGERLLERLQSQVAHDFRFGFKVTETITVKKFPNLKRYGAVAGHENEHFLNAELFEQKFLSPAQTLGQQLGVVIFEFSRFYPRDFKRGRLFVELLDEFLSKLPQGPAYAIEIRNRNLLVADYFSMLKRHQVAHVYNEWTHMPSVLDQLHMDDSWTTDFFAARFLLAAGRKYQDAVDGFAPYEEVKAANPVARVAGKRLIKDAQEKARRPSFLYVNNRLEGNALVTLREMVQGALE